MSHTQEMTPLEKNEATQKFVPKFWSWFFLSTRQHVFSPLDDELVIFDCLELGQLVIFQDKLVIFHCLELGQLVIFDDEHP